MLSELLVAMLMRRALSGVLALSHSQIKCGRAFKAFAATKRAVPGDITDGIEYYHKSTWSGFREWWVDRNGTSARNTLFEPCQIAIDHAVAEYADSIGRQSGLQLKVRAAHQNVYIMYIKAKFKSSSTHSWFDVIRYDDVRKQLQLVKGAPPRPWRSSIRASLRGMQLSGSSVSFDEEAMLQESFRKSEKQRGATHEVRECFRNVPVLEEMQKSGIVCGNSTDNRYYPETHTNGRPSDAVFIAFNMQSCVNHDQEDPTGLHTLYYAIANKQVLMGIVNRNYSNSDDVLLGKESYGEMCKYAVDPFELTPYFVMLKFTMQRSLCVRWKVVGAVYDWICPIEHAQLNGIMLKRHVETCISPVSPSQERFMKCHFPRS